MSFFLSGYTPPSSVSSQNDVKAAQMAMNADGASLKVDGVWGPKTQAAYTVYQQKQQQQNILNNLRSYSPGSNVGAAYDKAGDQYKSALDASYESNKADLNAKANQLAQQYDAVRNQAYVNSRLSAIGNNEALAAQGLAGGLYDDAKSGVSETSRVAQDVGMRNDINYATRQENQERDRIALEIVQSGYTRDMEYAKWMAEMQMQKAAAEQAAAQQSFQNQLTLAQMELGLMENQPTYQTSSVRSGSSGSGSSLSQKTIDGMSEDTLQDAALDIFNNSYQRNPLDVLSGVTNYTSSQKQYMNDQMKQLMNYSSR